MQLALAPRPLPVKQPKKDEAKIHFKIQTECCPSSGIHFAMVVAAWDFLGLC